MGFGDGAVFRLELLLVVGSYMRGWLVGISGVEALFFGWDRWD